MIHEAVLEHLAVGDKAFEAFIAGDGETIPQVRLTPETWEDLGYPETITATITAGNTIV